MPTDQDTAPIKPDHVITTRFYFGFITILTSLIFILGRVAETHLNLDDLSWISKVPLIQGRIDLYKSIDPKNVFYYLVSIPIYLFGVLIFFYSLFTRFNPSIHMPEPLIHDNFYLRLCILVFGFYLFVPMIITSTIFEGAKYEFVLKYPVYPFFCVVMSGGAACVLFGFFLTIKELLFPDKNSG